MGLTDFSIVCIEPMVIIFPWIEHIINAPTADVRMAIRANIHTVDGVSFAVIKHIENIF